MLDVGEAFAVDFGVNMPPLAYQFYDKCIAHFETPHSQALTQHNNFGCNCGNGVDPPVVAPKCTQYYEACQDDKTDGHNVELCLRGIL